MAKAQKKAATKKVKPVAKHASKTRTTSKSGKSASPQQGIDRVDVRMFCLGTGDCFVLKFFKGKEPCFTLMIDCGSCQGSLDRFQLYVGELCKYTNKKLDLLIVTHEHNDHVNGFDKCADLFKDFTIEEAWFAWTEDPDDPNGYAKTLLEKRAKMRKAFRNALTALKQRKVAMAGEVTSDYYTLSLMNSMQGLIDGLETLADVNLAAEGGEGNMLPGMKKIKELLKKKGVPVKYLYPGQIIRIPKLEGIRFNILGPPTDREYIFKDGKEGTDVYNKKLSLSESALAASAFLNIDHPSDIPFSGEFVVEGSHWLDPQQNQYNQYVRGLYESQGQEWRRIDNDWLNSAGSLALRLDSHINNTSLVMAIEAETSKKVLLFPGDAEYGSWESWHKIKAWEKKGANGKHLTEDLLNRTVFYKVGHHLSYNGTALEKGIEMMQSSEFAAMATLDRHRIAPGWKCTMPNKYLMQELFKKSAGKFFIMDEFEIRNGPSKQLDPATLGAGVYEEGKGGKDNKETIYKQFSVYV